MASSSAAITSQDSINSSLVPIMVYSGAPAHYFADVIICKLKYRLQDYAHLATPRKILTVGGALLDYTVKGVLQGLVADDYGNQILVPVDIVVVSGIGRNLFSATTASKTGFVTLFDYRNLRLEGFNVPVPLRSESGDLDLFMLDLNADGYGAKNPAMEAVANVHV